MATDTTPGDATRVAAHRKSALERVRSSADVLAGILDDLEHARRGRDEAVRAAREVGATLDEIGEALGGLSKQRVHDIAVGRYGG